MFKGRLNTAPAAVAFARAFDAACAGRNVAVLLATAGEATTRLAELPQLPARPAGALSSGRVLFTVRGEADGVSPDILRAAYA